MALVRQGLIDAIGDALISLVEWAAPRLSYRVDELLERVADTVRPDPPMTIRTIDGLLLTGLVVCDAGQVILFLGTRTPAAGAGPPPIPLGPSHPERGRSRFEDEAVPPWARDLDIDPYRRS